jgi:hypothetical protein
VVYYVNHPNAKLVANLDENGRYADTGDSCFLTLLQATLLLWQRRWVLEPAVERQYRRLGETAVCGAHLHAACEKIDYYRCPELYLVDTSNDMQIPGHLLAALTAGKVPAPRFGGRKLAWRNRPQLAPWHYYYVTLRAELWWARHHLAAYTHGKYYRGHLLMVRASTTYAHLLAAGEPARARRLRGSMRLFVKALEGETAVEGEAFPNPWFNLLAGSPPGRCRWVDNAHEWAYQRDPRDGNRDGGVFGPGRRKFHRERVLLPDGGLTEPLDMTHQLAAVAEHYATEYPPIFPAATCS